MTAKLSDVSKQAWKFQEGLVFLALQEVIPTPERIHWNYEKLSGSTKKKYTPSSMSIDPDIVIGENHEKPDSLVFVTHATAESASQKKFWRTVPEIIEEKTLPSKPLVYSVLFAGNVKPNLMYAYEMLFDGVYHLDDDEYSKKLSDALLALTLRYGKSEPLECLNILKQYVTSEQMLWNNFVSHIRKMYTEKAGKFHDTMNAIGLKKESRCPTPRRTVLRKTVCQLSTLPETLVKSILAREESFINVPFHAVDLGWFKKTISGYRLVDEDLIQCVKETPKESITYLVEKTRKLETMQQNIDTLSKASIRYRLNEWIMSHFEELSNPNSMLQYINSIFYDPHVSSLTELTSDEFPTNHWLFDTIMNVLRTETGRADGYGYSALASDVGEADGITGGYIYVADLLNRKNEIDISINKKISAVFSRHFVRLGKDRLRLLLNDSIHTFCLSVFNFHLINYRGFCPIEWIVCDRLSKENISYTYPSVHNSFLSNELGGSTTSTSSLIQINNNTWIKCQSGYNGKTDKRKELCGRIGAMKLCYSAEELKNKHYYLIIDGFFDDNDLQLFDKSGWDGIYYYDELDKLITIIN